LKIKQVSAAEDETLDYYREVAIVSPTASTGSAKKLTQESNPVTVACCHGFIHSF
jgi:hypothetical protein